MFLITVTILIVTLLFCLTTIWVMRKGSRPKLWLTAILATALAYILSIALLSARQHDFTEKLMFSYSLIGIFIAGLVLRYCRALMFPWKSNRTFMTWLLSVIAVYIVLYIGFTVFYAPPLALHSFGHIVKQIWHPIIILRIATFLTCLAFLIYVCIQIIIMYRRHQTSIAEQFSFREDISLSLLPCLVGFFLFYGVVSAVHILLIDLRWIFICTNFIYTGFYLCMTILGLRQQDIYTKVEIDLNKTESLSTTHVISAALRRRLTKELTELMLQKHLFRNPELRINEVALAVGTNRTYLSKIIRENFNNNFIGLVNKYRIKEAKELLSSDHSLSVIEISERVGFKSISSFYSCFKKETGVSPMQFRKGGG